MKLIRRDVNGHLGVSFSTNGFTPSIALLAVNMHQTLQSVGPQVETIILHALYLIGAYDAAYYKV